MKHRELDKEEIINADERSSRFDSDETTKESRRRLRVRKGAASSRSDLAPKQDYQGNYGVHNENLNGFGTGAGRPIDCR